MTTPTLRPATPEDGAALAEIRSTAAPHLVQTEAGMRSRLGDRELAGAWIAFVDDAAAAYAMCRRPHEGAARVMVVVHRDHQRRGLGSALLEEASDHATAQGAARIHTVADGDAGAAFATAHGFTIDREHRFSGVRLQDVPPAVPGPAGVSVVELGAVDPYEVWLLHDQVALDDPSGLSISQPYEEWYAEDWDFPDHAPDLGMAARDGADLVAFTHVFADRQRGRMWSAMTGVRRDHRGRGLARLVKAASLERAARAGLTHAFTANDAANHAMITVNEALGYRPVARAWSAHRDVVDVDQGTE